MSPPFADLSGVPVLSRPLAIGITILVSVVWAGNVIVGALYPDRHDATVNAIFAIIVGAVFGLTPKRDLLQNARRRLTRASDDEPPADQAAEPAEDTNPPRGDGT